MKNLIIAFLLFSSFHVKAQTLTPEEAFQRFSKYPHERIFVEFDKPDYLAGETVHFRAYVFSRLQLSRISTNLYFEYLDKNKKVIYKGRLPLYTGVAEGSYTIPKNLNEDVYYFRAYTAWMLNFDEKEQFIKPVNIYNPSSSTKITETPADWTATFHPDGGTLNDSEMKAAVRLHSTGSLPVRWTGYLFENSDPAKKVAEIIFLNRETGSLSFTPSLNKNYSIKITDDKQISKVIALPTVQPATVILKINQTPSKINYTITPKGLAAPYKIIAVNQGELIYSAIIKNGTTMVNSVIELDSLTTGMVHIALFDANGELATEKLLFIPPKLVAVTPAVEITKPPVAKRGLNMWWLHTDTLNNYTYTAKVVDSRLADIEMGPDFLNTFWLGEINSALPQTNRYFNPLNTTALDNFLMSATWGKTGWKNFLANPIPKLIYAPDNFLTFQGIAFYNKKIIPNKKLGLVIQVSDSSKAFLSVTTDNMGRFTMKNVEFRDTGKVFFRINNLEDAQKKIEVEFTMLDDFKTYASPLPQTNFVASKRNPGDPVPKHIQDYLAYLENSEAEDERYKKLEGVQITAKARDVTKELNKTLSSPIFSEPGEMIFDFINKYTDETGSGVIDFLEGKVPGLTTENGVAFIRNRPAAVYINEFAADYDQLRSYAITDIALVKVLRNAFALGSSAPVIAIYTKTGNSFQQDPATRISNTRITGYPKIEKFRMVDYDEDKTSSTKTDTRNVLYWNTSWEPAMNKQLIRFFNNDISDNIRLEIIGFNKEGKPVYLSKVIPVK